MRDKYSHEVARTLHRWGFYKKFTDAGYKHLSKTQMTAQEDPGLADGIFWSAYGTNQAAFIECKTGGDRFDFNGWVDKQREFATACYWTGYPYWIFLVMGNAVTSTVKPRVAYLITGKSMAAAIAETEKKSINYDEAATRWAQAQLQWAGSSTWEVPEQHLFYTRIIYGEYANITPYRHRALRYRRLGQRPTPREDRSLATEYYEALGYAAMATAQQEY